MGSVIGVVAFFLLFVGLVTCVVLYPASRSTPSDPEAEEGWQEPEPSEGHESHVEVRELDTKRRKRVSVVGDD
ncbi:MAG: hypothetical protein AB7N76_08365 [Planctomycetota bacterium]